MNLITFIFVFVYSILEKDKFMANEDAVAMLMGMSFTREQATKALKATDNNLERAADWIFSHQNELDALEIEDKPKHSKEVFKDGIDRMFAFQYLIMQRITHIEIIIIFSYFRI